MTAQDLGAVALPFTMNGSLGTGDPNNPYPPPDSVDVDFFRLSGAPGSLIQIDVEGQSSAQGTLRDPYLGYYDGSCNQIAIDDDGGIGSNARLVITVPASGIAVLGITKCCDTSFSQGGVGSYRLSINRGAYIGSISGRLIDAITGAPLTGATYTSVTLYRCASGSCNESVAWQYTDSEGRFRFSKDAYGKPLLAGIYAIQPWASGYDNRLGDPFEVGPGEDKDLGDIALSPPPSIGSISGQVADSSGQPLSGVAFPFAYVELSRCYDYGYCYLVNSQYADTQGRFHFETTVWGARLEVGSYRVRATASTYQAYTSEIFAVAANEHKDLDIIKLTARTFVKSISGRLVDALTGEPLRGDVEPFAYAYLQRCDEPYGYCYPVAGQNTDSQGRFRFDRTWSGDPLAVGTYQINMDADQYQWRSTEPFAVAADEEKNLGDIALQPYPVRFTELKPCATIPAQGGVYSYSVRITNGMSTRLDGATWSLVRAPSYSGYVYQTMFQSNPPRALRLAPGASAVVQFQFRVPAGVNPYTYICTEAYVAKDPQTLLFNTVGYRYLFCVFKESASSGFKVASEERARELFRRMTAPIPNAPQR